MANKCHLLWLNDAAFLHTLARQQSALGLAGIDEAGRGALAGPVFAAVCWFSLTCYRAAAPDPRLHGIADSKALSATRRQAAFEHLRDLADSGECRYAVGCASVGEIAELNILAATRLAMSRAIQSMLAESKLAFAETDASDLPLWQTSAEPAPEAPAVALLVDGLPLRPFRWRHRSMIAGDAHSLAIAAASVLAKVSRDAHMRELAADYPDYGFETHAGYGTKAHQQAILKHGACPEHRQLFLRKIQI